MCVCVCPSPKEKRSLTKAVIAARTLGTGPVVMAQSKTLEKEVVSAANALLDISGPNGPTAVEVGRMSIWMAIFFKKAENFAHIVADCEDCSGRPSRKALPGAEAIQWRFDKCLKLGDKVVDTADLKEFRMYRWMLSKDQELQYLEWQRKAIVTNKDHMQATQIKALEDLVVKRNNEQK